jgi:hypothetical protein
MTKSALIDSASIGSASMDSCLQASPCTGLFQLKAGRALRLAATQAAQLKIVCGSAWVTLPSQTGDHFLQAGQRIDACAGDVVVIESLQRNADVKFDWQPAVAHAFARSRLRQHAMAPDRATDLITQALRDLRAAAGLAALGVRGLGVAAFALFLGASKSILFPGRGRFSSFFAKS